MPSSPLCHSLAAHYVRTRVPLEISSRRRSTIALGYSFSLPRREEYDIGQDLGYRIVNGVEQGVFAEKFPAGACERPYIDASCYRGFEG